MKVQKLNCFILLTFLFFTACDSDPKVIQSDTAKSSAAVESNPNSLPVFDEIPTVTDAAFNEHKVIVEEILNTEKYSYLKVDEDGKKYWVAISKTDVEVGETYYFKGGLLKKNFFSKEFNRVFETVYLVSNMWTKGKPTKEGSTIEEALSGLPDGHPAPNLEVGKIKHAADATKLSDLFANKEKYANQTIKITGKCVKVNPMIMSRNWLHIQDGTGEGLDLTVTTLEKVPLGAVVSLEGIIALEKDFGAGYRYDIIMESAVTK